MKDFGEAGTMAEGDERRKSADEGGAEGVEMTTVDLSSPLPPRHAAPESPPGARLVVE